MGADDGQPGEQFRDVRHLFRPSFVIPAKAGIHRVARTSLAMSRAIRIPALEALWIPACAGMTDKAATPR
jgi:hypothetical protein